MTQEINALYNKNNKLIKSDYHFGWIKLDAKELAEAEGYATVIRVREGIPDLDFVAIDILKYNNDNHNSQTENQRMILPRTTLELISEIYKKI